MMGEAKTYIHLAAWLAFFPGLFLSLTVLGANLVETACETSSIQDCGTRCSPGSLRVEAEEHGCRLIDTELMGR